MRCGVGLKYDRESTVTKIGNYEVIDEIGAGGMGVVYRCLDPVIGRHVAVKVIWVQGTREQTEELRQRFAREAAAAGRLRHRNIVTVYHLGEDGDLQYLVMELIEGQSLDRLRVADCFPILRAIASALDYAHAKGVVHRDIKPSNILVDADGQVTVTDFGIARIATETMTMTGARMGTPAFMAPEQVKSARVDGRADQFSLAVLAFKLLTGQLPFSGD
jgi:serine/threonine-protein kinase